MLSQKTKDKIITASGFALSGLLFGPILVVIFFGYEFERVIKGMLGGFLVLSLSAIFELFIFPAFFKKYRFILTVVIRLIFYIDLICVTVIIIWVAHESFVNDMGFFDMMSTDKFFHFLLYGDFKYIFIAAVFAISNVVFFIQVSNLMGRGVLVNYITGKYHKPKTEERIFMFLDLVSSTKTAEKFGAKNYHKFMNAYFYDINDPIVESKGEIYQYAGDEVIISWKKEKGLEDNNCINCFFEIKNRIFELKEKYEEYFGVVPSNKAGLHCGEVVTGEVGDSKREIVFHGDVMNTTARIQSVAKELDKQIIISETLYNSLIDKSGFKFINLGSFKLKGKEEETVLYSVEK